MKALLFGVCLLVFVSFPPAHAQRFEHIFPFMAASTDDREGLLRIINHSDRDGHVTILGYDATGERFGPAVVTLEALKAVNLSSDLLSNLDLGQAPWQLHLLTDLDIEPLAYIRTADGSVHAVHDAVEPYEPRRYQVPTFNPSYRSMLHMVNSSGARMSGIITATDGEGELASGDVRFGIPPRASCTVSALQLESGSFPDTSECYFSGLLSDGARKWRLNIDTSRPAHVMHFRKNPDASLSNFSTSTVKHDYYAAYDEHRVCTNERELALKAAPPVVGEWDGTPIRVNMIRNFPDFVTDDDLWELLRPVDELARHIEQQLGYRVVEMGEIIDVAAGAAPGFDQNFTYYWKNDGPTNKLLPRERGQILVFFMDDYSAPWGGSELGSPMSAHRCCGTITYNKRVAGPWWTNEGSCCNGINSANGRYGEVLVHEIFHILGFQHPEDDSNTKGEAVRMHWGPLHAPWRASSTVHYAAREDIDLLRCIFPLP